VSTSEIVHVPPPGFPLCAAITNNFAVTGSRNSDLIFLTSEPMALERVPELHPELDATKSSAC